MSTVLTQEKIPEEGRQKKFRQAKNGTLSMVECTFNFMLHSFNPLLNRVLLLLHLLNVLPQLGGGVAAVPQVLQLLVHVLEGVNQVLVLKTNGVHHK